MAQVYMCLQRPNHGLPLVPSQSHQFGVSGCQPEWVQKILQCMVCPCMVSACLQVWFSSTWSSKTLDAFKRAVTELLTTASSLSSLTPQQRKAAHPSADALVTPDVLELLRHWQIKQVTLAAARSVWLDNADNSFVHISNLRRKVDRLALTELALTGELRALGPGDTGSVVMFAVPRKFGERAFDECFLQVRGRQCMTFTCTQVPQACN
jgi:hypothetical protein